MRKVRNQSKSQNGSQSNPLAMFSAGVEQVIRDHQNYQLDDLDQEAREMERARARQDNTGNLFVILLNRLC